MLHSFSCKWKFLEKNLVCSFFKADWLIWISVIEIGMFQVQRLIKLPKDIISPQWYPCLSHLCTWQDIVLTNNQNHLDCINLGDYLVLLTKRLRIPSEAYSRDFSLSFNTFVSTLKNLCLLTILTMTPYMCINIHECT